MVYYLPKQVLVVEGTVTHRRIKEVIINEKTNHLEISDRTEFQSADLAVGLLTVPDTSDSYILDLRPGGASEDTLAVQVSASGLLRSINVNSVGRAGEILLNVFKVIGSVGAIAQGLTGVTPAVATDLVENAIQRGKMKKESAEKAIEDLPPKVAFFLQQTPSAWALLDKVLDLENRISEKTKDLHDLQWKLGDVTKEQLEVVQGKVALLKGTIEDLRQQREAARGAFEARLADFEREKGLGVTQHTRRVRHVLELTDLPLLGTINPPVSPPQARTALSNRNRALALFDETYLIVEIDGAPAPPAGRGDASRPRSRDGKVYYRPPSQVVLRILARSKAPREGVQGAPDEIVHMEDRVESVLHPHGSAMILDFRPNAFATRNMVLGFDENGRLVSLQRSSTSAVEAATGAVANALTAALDQYDQTLGKINDIHVKQRTLATADLETQLAVLQKRKDLLDARLSLEGATANYDLILEKKKLEAELDRLRSEVALNSEQGTADLKTQLALEEARLQLVQKQADLSAAQVSAETTVELARLQGQLDVVKAQIALSSEQATSEIKVELARMQAALQQIQTQISFLLTEEQLKKLKEKTP